MMVMQGFLGSLLGIAARPNVARSRRFSGAKRHLLAHGRACHPVRPLQ